jgi:pilus assembly protein CpaB
MERSRLLRAIVIPLLIGAVATALVAWYIQSEEKRLSPSDMIPVVVAARAVPAKTILTSDMLVTKGVPRAYAPPNTLTKIEDAVGRVTTVALAEGEPLMSARVVQKEKAVGLSYYVPPGMRAVTMSVNEIIGNAAFPEPGDSVDVLGTFSIAGQDKTMMVLERLSILAVVRDTESKGLQQRDLKGYSSLTLAVTPQQAATLVWAEERGRLRLLLRPKDSTDYVGHIEANFQTLFGVQRPPK